MASSPASPSRIQFDQHSNEAHGVVALHENGDALNQISRQGRRLLSQYEKLTQQLLTIRQLFPPVAPDSPSLQSQPDLDTQEEPVETNLTEDQQPTHQSTESERVEIERVGTKLIDSVTLHFPLISQPAKPTPTTEIDAPARVYSAAS